MKYTFAPNFFFLIIAIILGGALVREFDFQTKSFENPALAAIYLIVFVLSFVWMIRRRRNK